MNTQRTLWMSVGVSILFFGALLPAGAQSRSSPRYRTMPTRSSEMRGRWQVGGADLSGYLGGRYHTRSSVLEDELPFGNGDLSGVIGVEFHEAAAYWLLALGGIRNPSGFEETDVDYVLTPELSLILKDRAFIGGAGILRSYISSDAEDVSGWSKTYYQLLLGFNFSMGRRLTLTTFAVYPFARWSRLRDFSGSDLEYSLGVSYRF